MTIQLLDAAGTVIGTTTTDGGGNYSFVNMMPATYAVREILPDGYFDGDTEAGSAGGVVTDDLISAIALASGAKATDYDFSLIQPGDLCGYVYLDSKDDGQRDAGDAGIANVTLVLKNADGQPTGATATTDANGYYCFPGLRPGTYTISEVPPNGNLDGANTPGSAGGTAGAQRTITDIVLAPGEDGDDYDFGELLPVSIGGHVGIATPGECGTPNTPGISGVTIQLLDASGAVIGAATTDPNGNYLFTNMAPGTYGIHELQPGSYFDGDTHAGSAGGTVGDDTVTNVILATGIAATNYDFCEIAPASLSGYVFQDGPPIVVQSANQVPDVALRAMASWWPAIRCWRESRWSCATA